jgi:hypothetical protein
LLRFALEQEISRARQRNHENAMWQGRTPWLCDSVLLAARGDEWMIEGGAICIWIRS